MQPMGIGIRSCIKGLRADLCSFMPNLPLQEGQKTKLGELTKQKSPTPIGNVPG